MKYGNGRSDAGTSRGGRTRDNRGDSVRNQRRDTKNQARSGQKPQTNGGRGGGSTVRGGKG